MQLQAIESLILSEVNVKSIEYLGLDSQILVKKIKANFKELGPKYGKLMKALAAKIGQMGQEDIQQLENTGAFTFADVEGQEVTISQSDADIITEDIPGWVVANENHYTVALDITITPELKEEGIARELVNRIQNLRKNKNFEVTDKISIQVEKHPEINSAVEHNIAYICSETLAVSLQLVDSMEQDSAEPIELTEDLTVFIHIERLSVNS
jgi:isoleucyl-tRNA synthetase